MGEVREALETLLVPVRWAAVGAVLLGGLGAVTGLVVGLVVHAPTALAATLEGGVPAAVLGLLLGLAAGSVTLAARAVRARRVSPGTSPTDR